MLYIDFENILEPLDDQCREELNRLNAERKCETPYTEKFNTDIPVGWCLNDTFTCLFMEALFID